MILDEVDHYNDPVFTGRVQSVRIAIQHVEDVHRQLPEAFQPRPNSAAPDAASALALAPAPAPALTPASAPVTQGTSGPPTSDVVMEEEPTVADIGKPSSQNSIL